MVLPIGRDRAVGIGRGIRTPAILGPPPLAETADYSTQLSAESRGSYGQVDIRRGSAHDGMEVI